MPTTPKHLLPYPDPTGLVNHGAADFQALASKLETELLIPAGGAAGSYLAKTTAADFAAGWVPLGGGWVPAGGVAGQYLVKKTAADFDAGWTSAGGGWVPAGGTAGQVLTKQSPTDYAAAWQNPAAGGGGGGATTPVAPTIDGLNAAYSGLPPDGATGVLRPAGTSDRLVLVYDGNLSKWISDGEMATHIGGPIASGTSSGAWRTSNASFQYSDVVNTSGNITEAVGWTVRDAAGLKPQLRWRGFLGSDTGSVTGVARVAYKAANAAGAAGAVVDLPASEQSSQGTALKLVGTDWLDIPAGYIVADYLLPIFALKSNGTNQAALSSAVAYVRWIG